MRQLKIIHNIQEYESCLQDIAAHITPSPVDDSFYVQWARQGDEWAFDRLILDNLRLVVQEAQQYVSDEENVELCDLIGVGVAGIKSAVTYYDDTHGIKFKFYALGWIRQSICEALGSSSKVGR